MSSSETGPMLLISMFVTTSNGWAVHQHINGHSNEDILEFYVIEWNYTFINFMLSL